MKIVPPIWLHNYWKTLTILLKYTLQLAQQNKNNEGKRKTVVEEEDDGTYNEFAISAVINAANRWITF